MSALAVVLLLSLAASDTGCAVDDGELTWGFKESFRSYISGTIANGEWTVEGANYETPNFSWVDGAGSYDRGEGSVAFDGAITFTGHDGILNTTVANPVIELEGSQATLLMDVSGTTQQGESVDERAVPFATLDLAAGTLIESTDGVVTLERVPAALTADGAAAFGTYEAGESLDPITVTFTTGEECVTPPAPTWLFGVLAIVVALAAAAVLVVRRRATARR